MALCLLVLLWMETSSQTLPSNAEATAAALLGTRSRSSPDHRGIVYHPVSNYKTAQFNFHAAGIAAKTSAVITVTST